jgi:hypothetical protein
MAFGSRFEHIEVQKNANKIYFLLILILGAPYSSYTVYRCSLVEIERPENTNGFILRPRQIKDISNNVNTHGVPSANFGKNCG